MRQPIKVPQRQIPITAIEITSPKSMRLTESMRIWQLAGK